MVAGDGDLEAKKGRSFVRYRPHDENDTLPVKMNNLQRAG